MGLVSLPFLNRVGVYTYWNNVWDNTFNYRNFYFFELYINFFFYRFFEDLTFNYLFKFFSSRKHISKSGYLNVFKSSAAFDLGVFLYLGKIWIFFYQDWYILKIILLLPSKELKKLHSKSISMLKLSKLFIRRIKDVKYINKYSYMNYKYKV